MKQLLIREIMAPLTRRVGTGLAAFLMGTLAVDPTLVDQFVVALGGVILIGFDLLASHMTRSNREGA